MKSKSCDHVWSNKNASRNCVKCGKKPGNGCEHVWGLERIRPVLSCEPGPVRYDSHRFYSCVKCEALCLAGTVPIRVIDSADRAMVTA